MGRQWRWLFWGFVIRLPRGGRGRKLGSGVCPHVLDEETEAQDSEGLTASKPGAEPELTPARQLSWEGADRGWEAGGHSGLQGGVSGQAEG